MHEIVCNVMKINANWKLIKIAGQEDKSYKKQRKEKKFYLYI